MEQKAKSVSPFSNENRNAYVVKHLTDAFLGLLKEKPVHEISIRELCDTAEVGRTSFYRNFETKEDIVKAYIRQILCDWMDEWKPDPAPALPESVYQWFSHLETNREFYALLFQRGLTYLLKDMLLELFGFCPEQEAIAAYSSAYVVFFLYGWTEVWFRRGMKETAAELAGYLGGAAEKGSVVTRSSS